MPNNAASPFDDAAGAVLHDDAQSAARPAALGADQLVSDHPTLAKYLVDPNNTAKPHDDIALLAAGERTGEAANLIAHAAILRARISNVPNGAPIWRSA